MKTSFNTLLKNLSQIANQFDEAANAKKHSLLKSLSKESLAKNKVLINYTDLLIFLCSHPSNSELLSMSEHELKRVASFLKRNKEGAKEVYLASGLPYTDILTRFSHDLIQWMLTRTNYQISLDSYLEDSENLNDILKFTLPTLERERTAIGLNNRELLAALYVKPQQTLNFLVEQLNHFNHEPLLKDFLFDGLEIYTKVNSNGIEFSRTHNRFKPANIYYHNDLLKKFDSTNLLNTSLPEPINLNAEASKSLSSTIKTSLILMSRETDPATYMDETSLKLFELERGISVAIYGMTSHRQLALESYVGYTLFKNGFATAYGGCWIFGQRSLFGINIFEPFRGGESGYVMCQLLRVYRQTFGINYFEVEPYQFGKDNPDGIASGAYWFYHRYGFRSVEKEIHQLSEKEVHKIKTKKAYRSSTNTLKQLAESFIALKLGGHHKLTVSAISEKLSVFISKHYQGKRHLAITACVNSFLIKSNLTEKVDHHQQLVLNEISLLSEALKITNVHQIQMLKEMVFAKPKDVYAYQNLMQKFLIEFEHNSNE